MDALGKVSHRFQLPPFDVLTATASELATLLEERKTTSVDIAKAFLGQIKRHNKNGAHLNCIISLVPEKIILEIASRLDAERAEGKLRSPLHGIPFVAKDSMWTAPCFSMPTTAGAYALKDAVAKGNADVVQALIDAGMLLLGKANLSEMAGMRGLGFAGWSTVGGQTQSPYVKGGLDPTDTWLGMSGPGGSSSGSAVAIAAGMAPVALGTETDGSILVPSDRASLYSIKFTRGKVSTRGTLGYTPFTDSLGPMTRSPRDLAALLDILAPIEGKNHGEFLTKSFAGVRVGFLDPVVWAPGAAGVRPNEDFTRQTADAIAAAADVLQKAGAHVNRNITMRRFTGDDDALFTRLASTDYSNELSKFLGGLENSPVKTMRELVDFNKAHASICLPPGTDQWLLEDALQEPLSKASYEEYAHTLRTHNHVQGLDKTFKEYDLDVIICRPTGRTATIAAIAGYPVGTAPLGYARFNGAGFGVAIIGKANSEPLILRLLSAWEAAMPARQSPPFLEGWAKATM